MEKDKIIAIAKQILHAGNTFDMRSFESDCGTTHCIAGFAIRNAKPEGEFDEVTSELAYQLKVSDDCELVGAALLGLSEYQATCLFYTANWPSKYFNQYIEARNDEQPTNKIAYDLLMDFANGKVEL